MTNESDSAIAYAVVLLKHYGFELRGYTPEELVNLWLNNYQANWIRLAVIESLYRGRYKAISVEQILSIWLRRGQPSHRFNGEFERLISRKLPKKLTACFQDNITDFNDDTILLSYTDNYEDSYEDTNYHDDISNDVEYSQPTEIQYDNSNSHILREEKLESTIELKNIPPDNIEIEYKPETSLKLDTFSPSQITKNRESLYSPINWPTHKGYQTPINQFTPPPDSSDFYQKLKKVAQQQDEN
ncbi:MAG TPA: hypothetical protein DEG17_18370 [Cyanobacteria bacterium UBA11149]|nr:hypothetical protein [Cyanobacteria bacterium UBA11367]HBE60496.1 hypothetical protein [Cyanobacteria bacterium UBA11366]HBK62813.1 hypothetical protein [Cyanobacteria bacterium UBA11166]HBR73687.1 hypothetical protein [Cyanobacteria bacterium UBA11159]HBS69785.1 hypothetical protein [Cyanobacteria bacterium UBA11153]HBW90777.1 hypothetical protein [Cyanobacteria bacterium UBA11149]HCA97296.1 hypothetical protein [Cyanobacteria bacterium UBA9226]